MSARTPFDLVKDILESIEHVREYSNKLSIEEFSADSMRVDACLYNVRIIGKAASKLSAEVKAANADIPWSSLEEMKSKLVHHHNVTDIQLLWNYIKFELPSLVKKLTRLQSQLSGEENKITPVQ
ncbi:MAG: HepT-like ribonuclease domain-containing protein [Ginsengibacter sp.]